MTFEGDNNVSRASARTARCSRIFARQRAFPADGMDLESKQVQTLTDGQTRRVSELRAERADHLYATDVDTAEYAPQYRARPLQTAAGDPGGGRARASWGRFW